MNDKLMPEVFQDKILHFPPSQNMLSERELREAAISCRAFPDNIAYTPGTMLRVLDSYATVCRMLALLVSLPPGARRDKTVAFAQKRMQELGFYRA